MGLYNRVTGSAGKETRIKEPKPFKPIELEQAFGESYRSYRVNGKPKMDVDTFFNRIRKELIELIKRKLKTRTSARIQMTAWIRFARDDEEGQERVECFKWSVIAAENAGMKDPQCISNLRKFMDNYDWSGLEFPVSIKDIGKFETRNNISVNISAVEGRDIYIHRKGQ